MTKPKIIPTDRDLACVGNKADKVPGSVEWCWQTLYGMKLRWEQLQDDDHLFQDTLEEVKAWKVWEVVPPDKPYGSLDALLRAEIAQTEEETIAVLGKRGAPIGNTNAVTHVKNKVINDGFVSKKLSGNAYRLAKLKKDHADIYVAYMHGEYSTVMAAWKAAGYDPEKTPYEQLTHWWRKASPEERELFLFTIREETP